MLEFKSGLMTDPVRILYVEDDAMSRDSLSRLLRKRGFEVSTAIEGVEAVAKAISEQPDVILMDIALPGIDGLEVTRQLKRHGQTKNIKVIGVSASATFEMIEQARSICDDFEPKPIVLDRLIDKIRDCL